MPTSKQVSGTYRTRAYQAEITGFGLKMLAELKANDAKKGDFLTWKPTQGEAVSELEHHVVKLIGAINRKDKQCVSEYSADIANTVMGINRTFGLT